ncbi:IclR family transcriptional regulator [Nocardia sp. NBC_00508]|uniref:IclR family transcriptional regulator n=1 Tax=Nocardia sp. NBC_00508 TaxID=2975992 RepID=UPI002E817E57|nr:IclR family transcriptional regulator [Nocardia sp. NBC_00508]WUD64774.1 IclR family transcriptional regulator [Nocardia sp. NBC_00508]
MRSVKIALQVLETVARMQPVGLSDLSRTLGLPKTTVHRSLVTLADSGWLEADDQVSGRWRIGTRAFIIGNTIGERDGLRSRALPVMNALNADVGETIHLMIPSAGEVILIERIDSTRSVRAFTPLGTRAPLHASSNGKAVLAYLSEREIEEYLRSNIEAVTAHTTTDPALLRAELAEIRSRGYAVNVEELRDGVVSVAASIRPGGARPIGSLSISAPKVRMPQQVHNAYGEKVRTAAANIAAALPASTHY